MAFEEEICPDDVETLVLPAGAGRGAQVVPAETQEMSQEATSRSPPPTCSEPPNVARETVTATSPVGVPAAQGDDGPLEEGALSDVAWADYEELYGKWKAGTIDDSAVVLAGGRQLLDLMQTQYVLDMEDTQCVPVTSTSTTTWLSSLNRSAD